MTDLVVSGKTAYLKNYEFPCIIGKNGYTNDKKEGDLKTPLGRFPLLEVYYRKDRINNLETMLPLKPIAQHDGWCDDVNLAKYYNKKITFPFIGSAEKLYRDDCLYDIIVNIGYNYDPAVPGLGSAIFLHCCAISNKHTKGCVALSEENLIFILANIDHKSVIRIIE